MLSFLGPCSVHGNTVSGFRICKTRQKLREKHLVDLVTELCFASCHPHIVFEERRASESSAKSRCSILYGSVRRSFQRSGHQPYVDQSLKPCPLGLARLLHFQRPAKKRTPLRANGKRILKGLRPAPRFPGGGGRVGGEGV